MPIRRSLAALAVVAGGVLLWSELVHRAAHRRGPGQRSAPVGAEAVVVLGFRNRGLRANAVNRHRMRIALRSVDPAAGSTLLVLCGGAVVGGAPEAVLLARESRRQGYGGSIALDRTSRSTWENIANAVQFIERADTIRIASNPLHAEKARTYLLRQRPDLAARLGPTADHRWGEALWLKPAFAAVGLRKLRALRSHPRATP